MPDLIVGSFYYTATFVDPELKIPIIQTLKYFGEDTNEANSSILLFDEIDAMHGEKRIFIMKSNSDSLILEIEGLLEVLQRSVNGELLLKGY
ncbi:hypothetical protein [Xanthomonas bonasiae]|uniref:hypothetical protein n=1 Tax=Xanthomonas bonasiae TaxID=2810351 RepID=UPI00197E05FB|nr:hypothetical protein [Xanthomonas bonasiae]MBN6110305.1 hypothetical protein [Xanthomonas bonasiae]